MKKDEFRAWLQGKIKEKPIGDCLSKCSRVEKALCVDLDKEYITDRCAKVLTCLQYSIADERSGKEADPRFKFKDGASLRFRYADLRSAVKKYVCFCENVERENV